MFDVFAVIVMLWYIYMTLDVLMGERYQYLPNKVRVVSAFVFATPIVLGFKVVGIL